MKSVYIAGPYTKGNLVRNLQRAITFAEILTEWGFLVYVPHLTHLWDLISSHEYEFWMKMDLEWLAKCDILFRIDGDSAGADREVDEAKRLGIPVYTSLDKLWTENENVDRQTAV